MDPSPAAAEESLETVDPPAPEPAVQPPTVPFDWEPWAWAVALVLLVALVYWPAVGHGYIWDDDAHVITNTTLRSAQGLHDMWLHWVQFLSIIRSRTRPYGRSTSCGVSTRAAITSLTYCCTWPCACCCGACCCD